MDDSIELTVGGMTCDHCVRAVSEAIGGVAGVTGASVDLEAGAATVAGAGVDVDAVIAAIAEEGYEAAPRGPA